MTTRPRQFAGRALVCAAGWFFSFALDAQTEPPQPPALTRPVPPMPPIKCPVSAFRAWLAKNPADRAKDLADRPPEIAKRLFAKLQEYDALPADERELRLRMTELRWYMLYFLEAPGGDRAAQVALVPEADRQLLGDRLRQWDLLPPGEQKEILKYERAMENFTAANLKSDAAPKAILTAAAPPPQPESLDNLENFLKLPPEQRRQMYASFQRFFELTDDEKQKTIGALPPSEQARIAAAMQAFGKLPQSQRDQCLEGFNKLSNLSDAERREFLQNAEKWRALSPAERQAWRSLVHTLTPMPPLPPGLASPPMPPPPLPTPFPRRASPPFATNNQP